MAGNSRQSGCSKVTECILSTWRDSQTTTLARVSASSTCAAGFCLCAGSSTPLRHSGTQSQYPSARQWRGLAILANRAFCTTGQTILLKTEGAFKTMALRFVPGFPKIVKYCRTHVHVCIYYV